MIPEPLLPPALLLMGPTASGKTRVAMRLAARLPVEIVSVDSALVYRDMDIGTAKASPEEQAQLHDWTPSSQPAAEAAPAPGCLRQMFFGNLGGKRSSQNKA